MVQFESKEIILKIETIFKNEEIQFNGNFMEIVDRAKEEISLKRQKFLVKNGFLILKM